MPPTWCLVFILGFISGCRSEKYCLAEDDNPYLYFATKTSYQFVYDQKLRPHTIPNCRPVQMWLLARHGTRYPGGEEIHRFRSMSALKDQIVANHEGTRKTGQLCYKDLQAIKAWSFNLTEEDDNKLAPQGHFDLYFLAKRLKTNFPDLLDATYTPDSFQVKYSEKERTRDSAKGFMDGMFGKNSNIDLPDSFVDNELLMPEKNCTAYKKMKDSKESLKEYELFIRSPIVNNLVASVSRRLGFVYNLTLDVIKDIWGVCRYEKAWNYTATSPWCAAFHRDELQILEYSQDLKYYYTSGYGNSLIPSVGCPLVRHMMENFKRVAQNESETPRAFLLFSHSTALRSVMTRLGIAKETTPLTHSNYLSMAKRQWRTSVISPFAGNLAAFFYKCSEGEENQIMLYVDEHEVDYEGCVVGLCSWRYIWSRFKTVVDPNTCNRQFCENDSNNALLRLPSSPLVLLPLIFLLR